MSPAGTSPIDPGTRAELLAEAAHLLQFGRAAMLPQGGFGWLTEAGRPAAGQPRRLYVTCRLTHSYSLGVLLGDRASAPLADHGLSALETQFRDRRHGGWYTALHPEENIAQDHTKSAYSHAFVILAAASATIAGRPNAATLLAEALEIFEDKFWEEEHGALIDGWDVSFARPSPYRGANAAMHGVEALLAAAEATGETIWARRAARIVDRMITNAREHQWRLPEHYDSSWSPQLDHHRDRPYDPFKPFGATPGHGLEWARLLTHLQATGTGGPALVPAARKFFTAALNDAWWVDGSPGLVYTVDWNGEPVIRNRLHWVLCEALAAAAALAQADPDRAGEYSGWFTVLWRHARTHYLDRDLGSWHHELDTELRPSAQIRDGKADVYHALQACLLPSLPIRPSIAGAVAQAGIKLPAPRRPSSAN